MNTSKVKQMISRVRQELPHKVETAESTDPPTLRTAIIIMLLPFIILWGWEFGGRLISPPERTLARPWHRWHSPYPPLTEFHWTGDLTRMARLPYYDRLLEKGLYPKRYSHRMVDERGFVNPPGQLTNGPIGWEHDYVLTGSSYMAEGSTMDKTLAAQIEQKTNTPLYNASWPGGSPTQGIIRLLTDDELFQGDVEILFFGMIQRLMYSWSFRPVHEVIDENGNVIKEYEFSQPDPSFIDYMEWRKTIENYLERTSQVRIWAAWAARFLPPMMFDLGYDSPVYISYLKKNNAPILFYPGDVASTYHSYEDRNGDVIVEAIRRIHENCEKLGVRLIILFVPDKYEVYRKHVDPKLYPKRFYSNGEKPKHPERRAPAVVHEKLTKLGIESIDFYPALYKAQFNNLDRLLYWVDDTHWSDHGIEVAANKVVDYLNKHPVSPYKSNGER